MLIYEILGNPVPWAAPQRCGDRFYSPKSKQQEQTIWQLRSQFNHDPLSGPVNFHVTFYMPIPKSTSKTMRIQMLNGMVFHIHKPDRTNLLKFIEDCFERAGILTNDSVIVGGEPRKLYGLVPKTVVRIDPLFFTEKQKKLYENIP